jgi:hypothetical protein
MQIRVGWTLALCLAAASQRNAVDVPPSAVASPSGMSGSTAAPAPPVAFARSCSRDRTVHVFARSNIFGAGIDELPAPAGGGGGVTPACIVVEDDVNHIRVTRVTGSISFVGAWFNRGGVAHKCATGAEVGNPNSGPDGVWTATTCGWEPDGGTIDAAGVVS